LPIELWSLADLPRLQAPENPTLCPALSQQLHMSWGDHFIITCTSCALKKIGSLQLILSLLEIIQFFNQSICNHGRETFHQRPNPPREYSSPSTHYHEPLRRPRCRKQNYIQTPRTRSAGLYNLRRRKWS